MKVICRFRVNEKAEVEHYQHGNAFRIKLQGAKSEPFGSATPSANCEMLIVPPDTAAEFEVGKYYLATFELDLDQEHPKY